MSVDWENWKRKLKEQQRHTNEASQGPRPALTDEEQIGLLRSVERRGETADEDFATNLAKFGRSLSHRWIVQEAGGDEGWIQTISAHLKLRRRS
ncbi:MAG TPA: hypothetical protein VN711_02065 [Candidatus Saccharimonadales bacterium]|nr:hypothetical protein [Candidatus Saccharimonadales bacterium]